MKASDVEWASPEFEAQRVSEEYLFRTVVRVSWMLAIKPDLSAATRLVVRPNQALEPTSMAVTNPAEPGFAPAILVAHL